MEQWKTKHEPRPWPSPQPKRTPDFMILPPPRWYPHDITEGEQSEKQKFGSAELTYLLLTNNLEKRSDERPETWLGKCISTVKKLFLKQRRNLGNGIKRLEWTCVRPSSPPS
jgi:hypothetical protein